MIVADDTRYLRIVLAGAITTNQLPIAGTYIRRYYGKNAYAADELPIHTVSNSTTNVTIVAAADSGYRHELENLSIYNADTVAATVSVKLYDGTNDRIICKVVLAVADSLVYESGHGWSVIDTSGQIKTSATGGTSFSDAEGDPANVTSAAADGTSVYAARRDHAHTIANDTVTNAMRANMADSTISGRAVGAGTGDPTDLTAAQAQAIIDTTTSALSPFARYTGKHIGYAASATNQSTTSGTDTYLNLPDTDVIDTDTMHFTSSAALTGTVTKTAASTTIAGSSTLFSSELSVGQMISIPGTAVEYFVVTAIASNTSLTVSAVATYTAAGQTATRMNSAVVVVTAGTYLVLGKCRFQSAAGGIRQLVMQSKRTVALANEKRPPVVSDSTDMSTWGLYAFAQWDWVELRSTQTSGTVNVNTADLALIRVGN